MPESPGERRSWQLFDPSSLAAKALGQEAWENPKSQVPNVKSHPLHLTLVRSSQGLCTSSSGLSHYLFQPRQGPKLFLAGASQCNSSSSPNSTAVTNVHTTPALDAVFPRSLNMRLLLPSRHTSCTGPCVPGVFAWL